MPALLLALLLSSAPPWQRGANETCQNYATRVEADDHALWRAHFCGDGPCFVSVPLGNGATGRSAAGLSVHPYWLNGQHGCDLGGKYG